MFRKAQAAMEFLMTYGWALLAVLVVIGALAYLGILDVETILPERCTFPVPLNCQDHVINSQSLQLVLLNGAGRGMDIKSIFAESEAFAEEGTTDDNYKCAWTPVSSGGANHLTKHLLKNGQSQTFTLRWSVPQDTTFSLHSADNTGVYTTSSTGSIDVIDPDGTLATRSGTIAAASTTAGASQNQITFNTAVTPVAAVGTTPALGDNCFYKDVGRGKNRYAITVYYTWSDSRSILHKVGGELFSASPE